jgi:hypothetical protein
MVNLEASLDLPAVRVLKVAWGWGLRPPAGSFDASLRHGNL